jgi:Tol biopolymer transport system component
MRSPGKHFVLTFLVAVALAACGGGGSEGGGDAGGGTGAVPAPPPPGGGSGGGGSGQAVINPGLTGKLFLESVYEFAEFDLATGVSRMVRPELARQSAAEDGSEFVGIDGFVVDNSPGDDAQALVFFGRDGLTTSRFLVLEGFGGTPYLSHDKKHVLVEWHSIESGDAGGVYVPTVFDREGNIVNRFPGYIDYRWLPDGRILLARGESIYTATLTGNPVVLATIPGENPQALLVSRDGSKIAFSFGNFNLRENQTWLMNADGSNIRQVVASGNSNNQPLDFSPDGNYLLVAEGINYVAVGPGYGFSGCAQMYAVPLGAANPIDILARPLSAGVVKLRRVEEDTGNVNENLCAFAGVSWRNVAEPSAPVTGTMAAGNGLNAGLTGTAYWGFAGDVYRGDLSSGAVTKIIEGTSKVPNVSTDGSEIVIADDLASGTGLYQDAVMFFGPSGELRQRVDLLEGFGSRLEIGPNRNLLITHWSNIDVGDGGLPIVTLFDRSRFQTVRGEQLFVDIARFVDTPVNFQGRTTDAYYRSFDWLPDGRLILGALNEIYVTSADSRGPTAKTRIAALPDVVGGITVSHDGTKIAFVMMGNVYTMNVDGSGLARLTDSGRELASPSFAPDGRTLLVGTVERPPQVFAVPTDARRLPTASLGKVGPSALQLRVVENGQPRTLFPSTRVTWR